MVNTRKEGVSCLPVETEKQRFHVACVLKAEGGQTKSISVHNNAICDE